MCWPSSRRLWLRIQGINSPVAFFLTFTRYTYKKTCYAFPNANVIPLLQYQFWSLSFGINSFFTWKLCLLTVILTDVHIHQRTKINPTKGKTWDCVHSAQFNLWDYHHHRLSISVRFLLNSYPNHLVPRTIHDQYATVLIAKIKTHCELTLKIFVMVIQAITVSFFLSINW